MSDSIQFRIIRERQKQDWSRERYRIEVKTDVTEDWFGEGPVIFGQRAIFTDIETAKAGLRVLQRNWSVWEFVEVVEP